MQFLARKSTLYLCDEFKYLDLPMQFCTLKFNTLIIWKGLVIIQKSKVWGYKFFHIMWHTYWIGLKGYENDQNDETNWLNSTCFPYCKSILPESNLYCLIAIHITTVLWKTKTSYFSVNGINCVNSQFKIKGWSWQFTQFTPFSEEHNVFISNWELQALVLSYKEFIICQL